MIYLILISLYTYLVVKTLLTITSKGKDISKKLGPKVSIIEFFLIALIVSYLFNYYYFQETEFENFIIPSTIIWMTFIAGILLLGIGIGVRFILNLMGNYISESQETPFAANKQIYEIFSGVWVNTSVLIIFFTYALMEISKPIERITTFVSVLSVYGLSSLLGILFYFAHKNIHFLIKRTTIISMILLSICLMLFIWQTQIDFVKNLPVTTSFILFNIAFFVSLIASKRLNRNQREEVIVNENFSFAATEPLLDEMLRAEMLTYLKSVDLITIIPEPSCQPTLGLLKPDVYVTVKEDWAKEYKDSVEYRTVKKYGGEVIVVDRQSPYISTTKIIQRAVGAHLQDVFKEFMELKDKPLKEKK